MIQKDRRAWRPFGKACRPWVGLRGRICASTGIGLRCDVGRIRSDVTELAAQPPDIIVANGRAVLSEAVQVIRSIPIVFVLVNDPVGQGFISSLARPGGNVTGFTFFEYAMFGKSLELLKEVAPAVTRVGFIFNPDMSASLIGRLGSSTFRLSTTPVSMSLTGSRFSSDSAPGPFHHGIRRRGGTIFCATLPSR